MNSSKGDLIIMANDKQMGISPAWEHEEVRAGELAKVLSNRINSMDITDANGSVTYLIKWAKELVWRLKNLENMKDERF